MVCTQVVFHSIRWCLVLLGDSRATNRDSKLVISFCPTLGRNMWILEIQELWIISSPSLTITGNDRKTWNFLSPKCCCNNKIIGGLSIIILYLNMMMSFQTQLHISRVISSLIYHTSSTGAWLHILSSSLAVRPSLTNNGLSTLLQWPKLQQGWVKY